MSVEWIVIPAAGAGTRMKVVNPALPKELLPLGKWPVIHYALHEAFSAGIKNVALIIHPDKEILREYVERPELRRKFLKDKKEETIFKKMNFHFLYQSQRTGESDAICLAQKLVSSEAMAIVYPDNVHLPTARALSTMIEVYEKTRTCILGLMKVEDRYADGIGNSGRINIKKISPGVYEITEILPKGTGAFRPRFRNELRACGFSIVQRDFFSYINRARRLVPAPEEFTDVPVRKLLLQEKGLLGVLLPGRVFDVGNPVGYRYCIQYIEDAGSSAIHTVFPEPEV